MGRPLVAVLLAILVLLVALPLGIGMAMDECPACHLPASGLLDGCIVATLFLTLVLAIELFTGSLGARVHRRPDQLLAPGLYRPPRAV